MKTEDVSRKMSSLADALSSMMVLAICWVLRQPQPKRNGTILVEGIKNKVEILRDRWEVPHIYAQSLEDLFFAQGFLHAQERLFQMDFQRRLVSGQLSEILGEVSVPLDRWMRTLTMYRSAEKEVPKLKGAEKMMLDSYVAGVNEFISDGKLPMEFKLLKYHPRPWTTADSIAWSKMMAWDLCVNWETEIMRAHLISKLGAEKASSLEPPYLKEWPTIVPPGVDYSCIGNSALSRAEAARLFTGPAATEGLGSNNWVLAGSRTASGKPLLANDMHLGMGIPSLWYENHLVAGEFNVSGLSFAGIPGIIQGHNAWVTWGFTNGFSDVQDLYMEHIRENEGGVTQYEYQGKWHDAEILNEVIQVKGQKPLFERVILTKHGPIINSLSPDLCGEAPLALCWVALHEDSSINALFKMNIARNCEELREALQNWTVPSQNVVYADIHGNTGYSFPGLLPIRAKGDGRVPVPGWNGEYEWTGYVPYQELPHMINAARGFIATANNKVVDDNYPYWLGVDVGIGNRSRRIEELIESKKTHTVEDIERMQIDQISITARFVGKILAGMVTDNEEIKPILLRFSKWDGHLAATSPEAAIYEVFIHCLMNRLLKPFLGDFTEFYTGKGPTPVIKLSNMLGDHSRIWLLSILQDQTSPWWDSPGGKSREDHLSAALLEAIHFLERTCGPNFDDWQWGKIHKITFYHTLGSVKPLDKLLNRGPYPLGGDIDTVWMGHATMYDLSYARFVGPQFRYIGDLSNWNNSRGVIVPGQSGHPASKHYDDGIDAWLKGKYHPMLFDREVVMEAVVAKLFLTS